MIWDVFLNIETPIVSLGSRWNITRITYFEEMITPFAQKKKKKTNFQVICNSFAYSDYGGESYHMLATLHQHCWLLECISPNEIKDPYMDWLGQATKCWVDSPEPIYIYTYIYIYMQIYI